LTGEIGTGKTTLCRFFLSQLEKKFNTAFILNPYFSETQLLEAIVKDYGIEIKDKSKLGLVGALNDFLIAQSEAGNNVVLIIDEAQNLTPQHLEQVRLLSNLETQKHKLIQIILVGQPELNRMLNLYNLRQLQQRIMVRYHITPLNRNEVRNYIEHRIQAAGVVQKINFSEEAVDVILDFSSGVPRLVNIICDRALLAGFVAETRHIDLNTVNKCVEELGAYFAKEV
jgi:general secretion pathway protein A